RSTLMHKIISCVLALHTRSIVYSDIKPTNMLFCSNNKVRLCDFAEKKPLNKDFTK
ncbi:hypothetical protein B0O99DRAFT_531436, partial [Bisporella sp. PMI_857]